MIFTADLLKFIENELDTKLFSDLCHNGLQVSGKKQIAKIISGVSISNKIIDFAIETKSDALLVHHGFFFKSTNFYPISGITKERLKKLFNNNINLFAFHLPLDWNPRFGNNIQLFNKIFLSNINNVEIIFSSDISNFQYPFIISCLPKQYSIDEITRFIKLFVEDNKITFINKKKFIKKIAICAGDGKDCIGEIISADKNIDLIITGEISERTYTDALEYDTCVCLLGHHKSEELGIKSLGEYIEKEFNICHISPAIINPF